MKELSLANGPPPQWVPAKFWTATTTAGAAAGQIETTNEVVNWLTWDFDQASVENIHYTATWPAGANQVEPVIYWTASSGSGNVVWQCNASCVSIGATIDSAGGSSAATVGALTAVEAWCRTNLGPIDMGSIRRTEGNPLELTAYRVANSGSDTLNADARLLGVMLYFR